MKFFVVAEAGCNHSGDWDQIVEMVKEAAAVGCDAIKFQSYSAKVIQDAEKLNPSSLYNERTFKAIREAELSVEDFQKIKSVCDDAGIEFMVTPFMTADRVRRLNPLVKRWKIRERDNGNEALIKAVYRTRKPFYVSVTSFNEDWANPDLHQVYCVPKYPATAEDLAERRVNASYLGIFGGYSNHIRDVPTVLAICAAAQFRGYRDEFYLELHYKLKGTTPIDDPVSLTGEEIGEIVRVLRTWEKLENLKIINRDVPPYVQL